MRGSLINAAIAVSVSIPLSLIVIGPTNATTISINDPFLQWYNAGPNDLHFTSGEFVRAGSTAVTPNGFNGTTGQVTWTNPSTGRSISRALDPLQSVVTPDFFSRLIGVCTANCSPTAANNPVNLAGRTYTLSFQNNNTTPNTASITKTLAGPGEIPFVNSVTLSGAAQAPTFSWSPPAGVRVDGYRVNIYQNNLETFSSNNTVINTGQVTSANLGPGTTSYTVQPSDFTFGAALNTNTTYTIEISALVTRNGSTTNLSNSNVSALSRVYSTFQVLPGGTPPVNLPTTTIVGNQVVNTFNIAVVPGVTYALDPAVAVGYVFTTGAGNPNFASVSLPDLGMSTPYELLVWNGSRFVFDANVPAETVFDFGSSGVSRFEVLGIAAGLHLDPLNPAAFVTDVTFTGVGSFTGTMNPITAASTPEASTWAMMMLGFVSLGFLSYRSSRGSSAYA